MSKNKEGKKDKRTEDQPEETVDDRIETVDEEDIPSAGDESAADDQIGDDEMVTLSASEYQALQEELADLRGRIVRQQADFDNIRKRLRVQADQAGQRVLARFVSSLLTEMDNFDHALKAANPDKFQDFAMGVTMIHQNLLTVLNGSGIELIPCEGVFDPKVHEVVQEVEDAEQPRGSIVEVLRQGYTLGDQVVRAAQVVVSRPPRENEGGDDESGAADASAAEEQ